MSFKLKWTVGAKPTGQFRSFEHRSWPSAEWPNASGAAYITCEDEYTPARARGEQTHAPLKVWVKVYRPDGGFDNRPLKLRAASIAEAKALVDLYYAELHRRPLEYRK